MIIKRIRMKNIRSYTDQEIILPLGSTVLAGDIGTGKTSILLAIEFALFGLQPGQKGSSLLRNGTKEGSVLLEIEVDGKNIIIERGLKRGKTVSQSFARIETNSMKKEMSVTELKSKILEILNYPKEFSRKTNLLYRFTVYTPQEEMKQIILEPPEVRLNTLRHIFGIDKYKRVRENTLIFASKLREEIREREGEIKNLEDLRKKLQEQKHSITSLENNIRILNKELEKRREERKNAEKEIEEVEEKIKKKEKYEKEAEKTKIMLTGKKEHLLSLENEIKNLEEQVKEALQTKFDEKELSNTLEEKKGKNARKEAENKKYLDTLGKINYLNSKISESEKLREQISSLKLCPTCLQNVDEDYKRNITRKLEEDIQKYKKERQQLEIIKERQVKIIEKLKSELLDLEEKERNLNLLKIKLEGIKEKQDRILKIGEQRDSLKKDILLLEKQIITLKESASLLQKYEIIYQNKKNILEEAEKKEKEKEIELAGKEKEKELALKIIEDIEKEIKEKENIKRKLQSIKELEKWLSSSFLNIVGFTEKNIMLKLREEFSKLFNEWFNILVPEIFAVNLDEDFTPVITQQDYQLDYSFLSGGERTAVALAYRLALNQVINSLLSKIKTRDLVILDEPTDGFSEQQLDKMRDVLNELKVRQLIIVSHEAKIESFVENIIKFNKEAGITRVEIC